MAESGLSFGAADFRASIGELAGWGRSGADYTANLDAINRIMDSGVRRVYYPPAINEIVAGYEWTWLQPYTTLAVVSGTNDYTLPDDFARFIGNIHYPADENQKDVVIVPTAHILQYRAGTSTTGYPRYACERWKSSDGTYGQRKETLLWPTPDVTKTMSYQYEAYVGPLTTANPYPLGGMKLAELFMESCLSVVEKRLDDESGIHTRDYEALITDAVIRDRKNGAAYYGPMGQNTGTEGTFRRGYTGGTYAITYDGDDV